MYAGRKVEEASVDELFARPIHPYTRGLMRAIPQLDVDSEIAGRRPRLHEITGIVPALTQPIAGCAFSPRCNFAVGRCHAARPSLTEGGAGHAVACWETPRVLEAAA
jgi:peptide/nickel transport system ATP-binding protein